MTHDQYVSMVREVERGQEALTASITDILIHAEFVEGANMKLKKELEELTKKAVLNVVEGDARCIAQVHHLSGKLPSMDDMLVAYTTREGGFILTLKDAITMREVVDPSIAVVRNEADGASMRIGSLKEYAHAWFTLHGLRIDACNLKWESTQIT